MSIKSRLLALTGFLLCLVIVILELYNLIPIIENERNIIPLHFKLISDLIFMVLFIVLLIKPQSFFLLSFITIIAGLINIMYGGHILGLLLYAFGFMVGLKHGFFRTHQVLKITLMLGVFFLILLLQLKIGVDVFVISFINILIAMAVLFGFLYLFHDNLKDFYTYKPNLRLGAYNFSERQLACIKGCMERKKLQFIAEDMSLSVSVIKREMVLIYEVLKVESCHELYSFLMKYTVVFE